MFSEAKMCKILAKKKYLSKGTESWRCCLIVVNVSFLGGFIPAANSWKLVFRLKKDF